MTRISTANAQLHKVSEERDEQVREWREAVPPKTQRWIARRLGITQQRVLQICKRINGAK